MEGPRSPVDSEYSNVLQFLDSNLKLGRKWPIDQEYPTALAPQNARNMRIIKDNGEILSHAVLRPLLTKTPIGMFKVGGIGSVVTSEKHRNQGLSRAIIEDCLTAAQAQQCDFAILWSNLYEFYRKLGFELAGTELSFVIDREFPAQDSSLRLVHGNNVSPDAILKLYNQHSVATVRTFDEVRRYLSIPNSNVYTAWAQDGSLKAYLVEGKGVDLIGYIHEWGGSVPAILSLLNFARQHQKRPLTIIVPAHSSNLIRNFNDLGFREIRGHLGMIKIVNPVTLLTKISRAVRFDHGFSDFVFEKRDRSFHIGTGKNLFTTDSENDMVRLIFGPYKPSDLYDFDSQTMSALERVLPIPMWIWGWDSI